jgi:glucose/arabinose dehydrogenase
LYLDITSRVLSGGERGLLGLAFHPQFSSNRRFYVNYTRRPDGATVVAEYRDGVEQRILFTIPQPYENHNGGMIEFGPDGYLYVGMGDGGSGNDPQNYAQNRTHLLGKMLRVNVDVPGSPPEIFAYGLRNPWRFSFDRLTGSLYAGDVGQNAREEIDLVVQGGNYGWRVWEGTRCTGLGPAACSSPGFIPPIAEYVNAGARCAVVGGYVYRGSLTSLPYGAYVYGDSCSGEIFMLLDGAQTVLLDTALPISSFGEDELGEIYVVGHDGSISLITNPDALATGQRFYATGDATPFFASTAGLSPAVTTGYARIQTDAGQLPDGVAIIALRQRGVLVSETTVPAVKSILSGRVFAETGQNGGTAIAFANPNNEPATVSFFFTDSNGVDFGAGITTIPPNQQFAAFLNEAPFHGPDRLQGTFTFISSIPVAPAALRGFTNEREDFLLTTLPVLDLASLPSGATTLAHFADGGGWTTQVILVNPSGTVARGSVLFVGRSGQNLSTTPYTVAPRSFARIASPGSASAVQTGSVRVVINAADDGSPGPPLQSFSVFSYRSNGVKVTETAVPALSAGTAFRMVVESSSEIQSGVAIANPSASPVEVRLEIRGVGHTLSLPANGQSSMFLNQLFGSASFSQEVLRITSPSPITVTGLRGHTNERGEFLITSTSPVAETPLQDVSGPIFPHWAEGGGYSMQFILFGRAAAGTMYFVDRTGNPATLLFR